MACKPCYKSFNRFSKTLDEIENLKKKVAKKLNHENDDRVAADEEVVRVKRCSKSPHQTGPPLIKIRPNTSRPSDEHDTDDDVVGLVSGSGRKMTAPKKPAALSKSRDFAWCREEL